MGLRYSDFVVPLVKAVQELSKQNEELQNQINELKAPINDKVKGNVTLSDLSLEQNVPNPFRKSTSISYTLPERFSNAQIVITDQSGKMIKEIIVSFVRKGVVSIDVAKFSSGVYNYSLIVDKRIINSKQMIIEK